MTQDELGQMPREQLIELLLAQSAQIAALRHENEMLRKKLEDLLKKPSNSKNSSQPPSLDRKSNRPSDRRRHRHGPPAGHEKHERQFVAHPDHVVAVRAQQCEACQTDLAAETGQLMGVNQITELPPERAHVIEVQQYAVRCPVCDQVALANPPEGLEMNRAFGSRLEATVVYYRQEQHMSYQRTQQTLVNLHGVTISQGGIDQIMRRVGQRAVDQTVARQARIQQSPVVYSDETSSRVNGDTWWEWVFCTLTDVLHVIRFNRSVDVPNDVMGAAKAEVWVSDCLPGQLKAPAKGHQLCLAHQLRNLQAAAEASPVLTWPRAMQVLFRAAIHLHHQRDQLPPDHFTKQHQRIERHCDRLLRRDLAAFPKAEKLKQRYLKYRQSLFVFLYRSDVEPTNNVSERALRHSVIHRKVMGSFRSEWGAKGFAALASVIDSAALSAVNAFDTILALLAPPALPLPLGGE